MKGEKKKKEKRGSSRFLFNWGGQRRKREEEATIPVTSQKRRNLPAILIGLASRGDKAAARGGEKLQFLFPPRIDPRRDLNTAEKKGERGNSLLLSYPPDEERKSK